MNIFDVENRWWVIPSGVALMGLTLGSSIFIRPDLKKLRDLKGEQKSAVARSEIQARITSLEGGMVGYENVFLPKGESANLLEKISQKARESGVRIVSMEPLPVAEQVGYSRMPLKIDCEGTYHPIGRFVSKIESSKAFMKISKLEMRPKVSAEGRTRTLEVSMIISVFLQQETR